MNQQQPTGIALIATAVIFLALGAGAGAVWMKRLNDTDNATKEDDDQTKKADKVDDIDDGSQTAGIGRPPSANPRSLNPSGGAPRPGGGGLTPGGGIGMGMGMGMGMGGNPSKAQLTGLVAKLDLLTSKPLSISLNDEQRTKLTAQLKGLAEQAELTDDDAKKRLDAILEIVKSDKQTLEAAGYRWPTSGGGAGGRPGGGGGARGGPAPKNPFTQETTAKHLKSFQELLAKPGK